MMKLSDQRLTELEADAENGERMKRIVQHQWPVLAHAIRRATT